MNHLRVCWGEEKDRLDDLGSRGTCIEAHHIEISDSHATAVIVASCLGIIGRAKLKGQQDIPELELNILQCSLFSSVAQMMLSISQRRSSSVA